MNNNKIICERGTQRNRILILIAEKHLWCRYSEHEYTCIELLWVSGNTGVDDFRLCVYIYE